MKFKEYLKTWEGSQEENKWGRYFQAALIVIVLLLVVKSFSKETIVTIQPFTLTEDAWVTKSDSSKSYKEAWGFALAQLFGNVTPATVDFILERIKPLLSPAIYQDVIDAVEIQAQKIKNDRVSLRFEPRFVEYEQTSDKIFVYGYSFVKGTSSSAKEKRTERTYEFTISIKNFAPLIENVQTYDGKPKTEIILQQLKSKEEARLKNEAKK